MSFLGSVATLNGVLVRPHDIELEREASVELVAPGHSAPARVRARVERIVRLGFEVRVDLGTDAGERFAVQMTRSQAADLDLRVGETVFARAARGQDPELVGAGAAI
ncbi:TOBE-like domain-containing protein [Pedococcus sp. 2YAF34]|uniref:TOBE-like domain-containing protein n=1 Tax=Pedococcus sp. 2YAF34 TaxID=3233032 RepID=UPI003F99C1F4